MKDRLTAGDANCGDHEMWCDFDDALRRLEGDLELLQEIADIFLQTTPETMDQLQDCIRRNEPAAVAAMAHQLKGALGNFVPKVGLSSALDLERLGRAGDLQGADAVYACLETDINHVSQSLRALLRSED